ncbi:MAG: hypothetical protein HFF17_01705 [Oscillospiraceae bacterium]|nr:hypothetical protein [Oscillospiraceae bacterium]
MAAEHDRIALVPLHVEYWHGFPLRSVSGHEKMPQTFFRICGVCRGAETGGALPASPVFCVAPFFAALQNMDFAGFFHVLLWQRP